MSDADLDRAAILLTESREARRLREDDERLVRIRELANRLGVSRDKILDDGRRGEFVITWVKCGTRRYAYVTEAEARKYLERVRAA